MVATRYERGVNTDSILIESQGHQSEIPISTVLSRCNVQEIIRIPLQDYDHWEAGMLLTHFNLPIHDSKLDSLNVLPKIIQHGTFVQGVEEKLPVLSFSDIWVAKILEVFRYIPYDHIPYAELQHSVGNISSREQLQKLILKRYQPVLFALSDEEILSQNVSMRKFQLIRKETFIFE